MGKLLIGAFFAPGNKRMKKRACIRESADDFTKERI